jgi:hypothetical protein
VNKTELIERVAQEAKVSTSEAQRHFEAFERVVTEALKGGEERTRKNPNGTADSSCPATRLAFRPARSARRVWT